MSRKPVSKRLIGLQIHLIVFIAVSVLLLFINLFGTKNHTPWALVSTLAWGLALLIQWWWMGRPSLSVILRKRRNR